MEPGSSNSIVPFSKTYARAELASLHYTVFIEALVVGLVKPLSFNSGSFYNFPNNEPHPLQVIPLDPFLIMEDQYFTAATLHQNMSNVWLDDLTPVMPNNCRLSAKWLQNKSP
jgi:hypothetical protein